MEDLLAEGLRQALGLSGEERDIAKYVCALKSGAEAQDYLRSLLPPSPTTDTLVQAIGDQFAQRESQAVADLQASQDTHKAAASVATATTDGIASAMRGGAQRSPKEQARQERRAKKAARVRDAFVEVVYKPGTCVDVVWTIDG
jgi:hypothetical protein